MGEGRVGKGGQGWEAGKGRGRVGKGRSGREAGKGREGLAPLPPPCRRLGRGDGWVVRSKQSGGVPSQGASKFSFYNKISELYNATT